GTAQGREERRRAVVGDADDGDPRVRRRTGLGLGNDRRARRSGDVSAIAGPRHVGVARGPALTVGGLQELGVTEQLEPAVVALLGAARVLVGLAAQVVLRGVDLLQRAGVPRVGVDSDEDERPEGENGRPGPEPTNPPRRLHRFKNFATFVRNSSVSKDSVSDAIAKSMVARTERSTCRFSTRLVASTAWRGRAAIFWAVASACGRTSSSGTMWLARPIWAARSALMRSPVNAYSLASSRLVWRGHVSGPPSAATRPTTTWGSER